MSVDEYVTAGREIEVPRRDCPVCAVPMTFWSGYRRSVRTEGGCSQMWVPRARCRPCDTTHALVPAFVVLRRLDVAETVGAVIEAVVDGPGGVRPAAERAGVPHTTARGWLRRFGERAEHLAITFAALAVDLGRAALAPVKDVARRALVAMKAAFSAALGLPGWEALGAWRFANAVVGGRWLATNTDSPWLIVGNRRFMPPVP